MLEFQAHICWVITVDYKVRLGQVKSEFDWKSPKLTRSVQASKFQSKFNLCTSTYWLELKQKLHFPNTNIFLLSQLAIGVVAVVGVAAAVYNDQQNKLNDLNDKRAKLLTRVSSLEAVPGYSLPSSITTGIAANCAALNAIDTIADPADADQKAALDAVKAAFAVTC